MAINKVRVYDSTAGKKYFDLVSRDLITEALKNDIDKDELVKVAADDTVTGYLPDKMLEGTNITFEIVTDIDTGEKKLKITSTGAGVYDIKDIFVTYPDTAIATPLSHNDIALNTTDNLHFYLKYTSVQKSLNVISSITAVDETVNWDLWKGREIMITATNNCWFDLTTPPDIDGMIYLDGADSKDQHTKLKKAVFEGDYIDGTESGVYFAWKLKSYERMKKWVKKQTLEFTEDPITHIWSATSISVPFDGEYHIDCKVFIDGSFTLGGGTPYWAVLTVDSESFKTTPIMAWGSALLEPVSFNVGFGQIDAISGLVCSSRTIPVTVSLQNVTAETVTGYLHFEYDVEEQGIDCEDFIA